MPGSAMFIAVLLWPSVQITSTFISPSLSIRPSSNIKIESMFEVILHFTVSKIFRQPKESCKYFHVTTTQSAGSTDWCLVKSKSNVLRVGSVVLLTCIIVTMQCCPGLECWLECDKVWHLLVTLRDSAPTVTIPVTGYHQSHGAGTPGSSQATDTFESHYYGRMSK